MGSYQAPGRLSGKNAIITGAAGGIGLETTILFAREGASVLMADISAPALAKALTKVRELIPNPPRITTVVCDVSSEPSVAAMVESQDEFGGIDIMFNNAGIMHAADDDAIGTPENVWDLTQAINVKGVWFGCKHAVLSMRKHGKKKASVINVASVVALVGSATAQLAYTASRVQSSPLPANWPWCTLARVSVSTRCARRRSTPHCCRTGSATTRRSERDARYISWWEVWEAIEQAYAVLFLASDESSFINGVDFVVDGGMSRCYITPEGPPTDAPLNNAK